MVYMVLLYPFERCAVRGRSCFPVIRSEPVRRTTQKRTDASRSAGAGSGLESAGVKRLDCDAPFREMTRLSLPATHHTIVSLSHFRTKNLSPHTQWRERVRYLLPEIFFFWRL